MLLGAGLLQHRRHDMLAGGAPSMADASDVDQISYRNAFIRRVRQCFLQSAAGPISITASSSRLNRWLALGHRIGLPVRLVQAGAKIGFRT